MDRRYLPTFVPKVSREMEGARDSPYQASFAGGQSGLSFGRAQNDVAANRDATHAFYGILNDTKAASGLSDFDIVMATLAGMTPGATQQDLEAAVPGGFDKVNRALRAGYATVDARDATQERAVLDSVNDALNTAGVGSEVDPHLVTDIAAWRNMTGDLKRTGEYMRDNQVSTRQQYDDGYLSRQPHFQKRPGGFPKFSERVDDATRDALADTLPELQSPVPNLLNSQPYRDNVYDSVGAALNGGERGAVSDAPTPRAPEVRLWDEETDAGGPTPGNLLNVNALPENLLNMPDYELRKWGLR